MKRRPHRSIAPGRALLAAALLSAAGILGAQAPAQAPAPAQAQAPTRGASRDQVDAGINARIREEATKRSQVLATARTLSDGFGPRLSGSPGYTAAANWAVRELTRVCATRAGRRNE